jgi:selenide,water dikinase
MGQLAQVLRDTSGKADERVLVGPETFDDAGVVSLGDVEGLPTDTQVALVQTVDYFPPVVDDPYLYGAIAAANSLSDLYAMGAKPFTALNLAGIPRDFPPEWTAAIFRGGFEKIRESGAAVIGGHTVQSNEAMFGFAVTGWVDRRKIAANSGAQAGDVVYLTKSLGMGALTTAAKQKKISWETLEPAARQMATLNDRAAEAMNAVGAHACTDVTGFGLVGHARNIAAASRITMQIDLASLPIFPGALELVRGGVMSGASKRGQKSLADVVKLREGVERARADLAFDAETSGGLLIVVAARDASALERELMNRNLPVHRVGECRAHDGSWIELV